MSDGLTIWLETVEFSNAVEAALMSARAACDSNGLRILNRAAPHRMALEIREAIGRACGVSVEVIGWDEMIAPIEVSADSVLGKVMLEVESHYRR